ncbi:uncharacterized protein DDB_G0271670 [Cyclospora cayetanensis]|uniref:Uncharacterized protein DDB_G0271670 n=1 Tax=Cyclospora cayetanensis TaxID=88456 RepID=A0A6P6RUM5_9EIME|nr:uncharacterized protein DDB_G0271670 [Cyclospora cayetanensis]
MPMMKPHDEWAFKCTDACSTALEWGTANGHSAALVFATPVTLPRRIRGAAAAGASTVVVVCIAATLSYRLLSVSSRPSSPLRPSLVYVGEYVDAGGKKISSSNNRSSGCGDEGGAGGDTRRLPTGQMVHLQFHSSGRAAADPTQNTTTSTSSWSSSSSSAKTPYCSSTVTSSQEAFPTVVIDESGYPCRSSPRDLPASPNATEPKASERPLSKPRSSSLSLLRSAQDALDGLWGGLLPEPAPETLHFPLPPSPLLSPRVAHSNSGDVLLQGASEGLPASSNTNPTLAAALPATCIPTEEDAHRAEAPNMQQEENTREEQIEQQQQPQSESASRFDAESKDTGQALTRTASLPSSRLEEEGNIPLPPAVPTIEDDAAAAPRTAAAAWSCSSSSQYTDVSLPTTTCKHSHTNRSSAGGACRGVN